MKTTIQYETAYEAGRHGVTEVKIRITDQFVFTRTGAFSTEHRLPKAAYGKRIFTTRDAAEERYRDILVEWLGQAEAEVERVKGLLHEAFPPVRDMGPASEARRNRPGFACEDPDCPDKDAHPGHD